MKTFFLAIPKGANKFHLSRYLKSPFSQTTAVISSIKVSIGSQNLSKKDMTWKLVVLILVSNFCNSQLCKKAIKIYWSRNANTVFSSFLFHQGFTVHLTCRRGLLDWNIIDVFLRWNLDIWNMSENWYQFWQLLIFHLINLHKYWLDFLLQGLDLKLSGFEVLFDLQTIYFVPWIGLLTVWKFQKCYFFDKSPFSNSILSIIVSLN